MDAEQIIRHLSTDHGIDPGVAREVIAGDFGREGQPGLDERYLRGFHDGTHGRIDADDLEAPGHIRYCPVAYDHDDPNVGHCAVCGWESGHRPEATGHPDDMPLRDRTASAKPSPSTEADTRPGSRLWSATDAISSAR